MRVRSALVILLFVLGTLAVSNPVAADDLETVIALYRSEGAAAALPGFEEQYRSLSEQGDPEGAAEAMRYIGECHWRLGDFEAARGHLDTALETMVTLGMRLDEGKVLNVLGLLEWDLGRYDLAIDRFRSASAIGEELGDKRLAGSTMNNLSLVYDELGDYTTSLAQYEQALQIYEGADFPRGMSDTLGNIGGVHLLMGRYLKASEYYHRALAISEDLGSNASMSLDHGNLGFSYLGLGKIQRAIAHFDQAIELAVEAGMPKEQALWTRGKGNALIAMGRYDEGLELHRGVLGVYQRIQARGLLLDALSDVGQLHLSLGDPVSAERYFEQGIELAQQMGHARGITSHQIALGDVHLQREQLQEAEALYGLSRQRATDADERHLVVQATLRLSTVHLQQSRLAESEANASAALRLAQQTGATGAVAQAHLALGETRLAQQNAEAALRHFQASEQAQAASPDPQLQWQVHYGKARAYIQNGERETAVSELQAAVRVIEGVRERLQEERFRAGYIQDKYRVYVDLVRLQFELGQTRDAFSTAERLRSRRFLNQLERSGPISRSDNDRNREVALRERVRALQQALENETTTGASERRQLAVDHFSAELLIAERDYQAFMDDLLGRDFAPGSITLPSPEHVQQQLRPNEALVEYVVGSDDLLIFVMRRGGLTALRREIRYPDLHAKVNLVRELIQGATSENWRAPAASLSDHLVKPLVTGGLLEGVNHLFLVPHDVLNYLPFSLLSANPEPGDGALIDQFSLTYLPAAAALTQGGEASGSARALLAMAPRRSRLKFALEEARSISNIYQPDATLLTGSEATESAFKNQAGYFRVLHLSTHGYFNPDNPLLSGLELEPDAANDGYLEVHEIFALRLDAGLVTLSACQTGMAGGYFNRIPAGDDFVGLTRAFLYAGSRSVLATLWEVDDRSTVDLMKSFYANLASSGSAQGRADALARVQRMLRKSERYNHPFYWAPFVLVDGRGRELNSNT